MSSNASAQPPATLNPTPMSSRWGAAITPGFVVLPNVLLKHQREIGLTPNEVVLLANILSYWYEDDRLPFPRATTLARRMGLSVRSVQRMLSGLERRNLIARIKSVDGHTLDPQPVRIDMSGLVSRLQELGRVESGAVLRTAVQASDGTA